MLIFNPLALFPHLSTHLPTGNAICSLQLRVCFLVCLSLSLSKKITFSSDFRFPKEKYVLALYVLNYKIYAKHFISFPHYTLLLTCKLMPEYCKISVIVFKLFE